MKDEKICLASLFNEASRKLPESANVVAIFTVSDDNRVASYISGIDELGMSPDCLALVASLDSIMNGHLKIAKAIYERIKEENGMEIKTRTIRVNHEDENGEEDAGSQQEAFDPRPSLKEAALAIGEVLSGVFGGVKNADDT